MSALSTRVLFEDLDYKQIIKRCSKFHGKTRPEKLGSKLQNSDYNLKINNLNKRSMRGTGCDQMDAAKT